MKDMLYQKLIDMYTQLNKSMKELKFKKII